MAKMSDKPNPQIPLYYIAKDESRRNSPVRPRRPMSNESQCPVHDRQGNRCVWVGGHLTDGPDGHKYEKPRGSK